MYKPTDEMAIPGPVLNQSVLILVVMISVMDPRNPKILYAAFHQRMRKVFTYIGGGPESAIYKSTDGGASWKNWKVDFLQEMWEEWASPSAL